MMLIVGEEKHVRKHAIGMMLLMGYVSRNSTRQEI